MALRYSSCIRRDLFPVVLAPMSYRGDAGLLDSATVHPFGHRHDRIIPQTYESARASMPPSPGCRGRPVVETRELVVVNNRAGGRRKLRAL
jgi:hypothetical protein